MIQPKQSARLGEFHLEEAILDVLLEEARQEQSQRLGAAEISKRAGIFRERGDSTKGEPGMNDAVATGMLIKLLKQDKVKHFPQGDIDGGGWKLTEKEFDRRNYSVNLG